MRTSYGRFVGVLVLSVLLSGCADLRETVSELFESFDCFIIEGMTGGESCLSFDFGGSGKTATGKPVLKREVAPTPKAPAGPRLTQPTPRPEKDRAVERKRIIKELYELFLEDQRKRQMRPFVPKKDGRSV